MNKIKAEKDIQRNAFLLTINNPSEKGYTHSAIKEELISSFSTLRYMCMADEIGAETKTYHTHVYMYCTSRIRFSKVKKSFPEAHIDVARGSVKNNIDYVKKTGKWENTEKAETRVEGTFEEWGESPTQKGEKPEMEELYQMVLNGYSNAEILAMNNDYILQIDKIDKLRTILLTEKFKNTRRIDLKVVYVSGVTGEGKTRDVLDRHGDCNVYRICDYTHPFDGYNCQPVMAFDEYRSQLSISDMLQYCDIYPIELKARYSNKFACYETVYIISNWSLEQQYETAQREDTESWQAFLRRIHEVIVYEGNGKIVTYDSVEKYMHRNEQFHPLSPNEATELPFKE